MNIFSDELKFAEFILISAMILEQLLESKYIHKLKIVSNMIELTESIAKIEKRDVVYKY